MELKKNGVYILKEEFFEKYEDKHLSQNRGKGRPFYYVFSDKKFPGIYWVVPLTSKLDKVKKSIEKFGGNEKDCPYYVINHGVKDSAFNIGNTFPTLEKYIEREYINNFTGSHLIIKNTSVISEIERKASKLIRKNLQIEVQNSVNLKKLIPLLQAELLEEKSKELIPHYNPLTGHQISLCPGEEEKLNKMDFSSSAWICKGDVKKHNIEIKENAVPVSVKVFSLSKEENKPCMKDITIYNVAHLNITKELSAVFKEPVKKEKQINISKNKNIEIER